MPQQQGRRQLDHAGPLELAVDRRAVADEIEHRFQSGNGLFAPSSESLYFGGRHGRKRLPGQSAFPRGGPGDRIVMYHDDVVSSLVNVQLDATGPQLQSAREGSQGILGCLL